ncbi:MAG: type II toxin-antitoxin system VapC family toxin [Planctomycetaceae bacterium]|nr:type II toxin-antitoxin system VapC family toxin [Planctomycetaceae bacterium]
MMAAFADTFYYLALVNPADEAHQRTLTLSKKRRGRIITTAWVLTEVADALCGPANRTVFTRLIGTIRSDRQTEIAPPSSDLFNRGVDLYARRIDKSWSLTDCISFVVMADRGLIEALTADHHFEQAGFRALLRTP